MSKKKVNFSLAPEIVGEATTGILLGEFNNWDTSSGIALTKDKDGSLSTSVALETGKSYEYRYLLNDGRWVNDRNADSYSFVFQYQIDNCVISVLENAPKETKKVVAKPSVKAVKKTVKIAADDLTKIEGIGKKIADLFAKEGILSYEGLSKTPLKKLKEILATAGSKYQMHDPKTWSKQAKLAAGSKWDELKTLQAVLKSGK